MSDPFYDRGKQCMATDVAVKPGRYVVYIAKKDEKEFGIRVATIMAVHEDYVESLKANWEPYECCIRVDSTQCGIFDDIIYPTDKIPEGEHEALNSFLDECCKLTLSDEHGGILNNRNGVVSLSGYGDGYYKLLCQYHEGERIALMVDYDLEKNSTIMRELIYSQRDQPVA